MCQRVLYITTVQTVICCAAGLRSLMGGFDLKRYVTSHQRQKKLKIQTSFRAARIKNHNLPGEAKCERKADSPAGSQTRLLKLNAIRNV